MSHMLKLTQGLFHLHFHKQQRAMKSCLTRLWGQVLLICFPLADLYCQSADSSGPLWIDHLMKYVMQSHELLLHHYTLIHSDMSSGIVLTEAVSVQSRRPSAEMFSCNFLEITLISCFSSDFDNSKSIPSCISLSAPVRKLMVSSGAQRTIIPQSHGHNNLS